MRPIFTTATHSSGLPLPLPMRVSAGFLVMGLSGKTRIHTLPPRFTCRVMATRAASICREVSRPVSSALSPKSPKASVPPRYALPRMRPFCCLRCLTFLGWSMGLPRHLAADPAREDASPQLLVRHVPPEDPALDADHAVGRLRLGEAVVDLRPQGVERHAPLAVPLTPTHLRAAEPPRALDANPTRAELHGRCDRLLHRPAECDAPLELERHVLGHEHGVELRFPDLLDVDEDLAAPAQTGELGAQRLDLGAALPDQDPGPGGVDVHDHLVAGPLDHDLRDPGVEELLLDVVPEPEVLVQPLRVVPLGEPVGLPPVEGADPEAVRMNLLSHGSTIAPSGRLRRGSSDAGSSWPVPGPGAGCATGSAPRPPGPSRPRGCRRRSPPSPGFFG